MYNAGGVKHAAEIDSRHRGKETDVVESHMTRDRIDVEVCFPFLEGCIFDKIAT